jgi:hypothetical protein
MKSATKKPTTRKRAQRRGASRSQSATAHRPASGRAAAGARSSHLIVDATNVICGPQDRNRLDLLLSLVVAEASQGRDVLCIFDATTPHRLRSDELELYRWLLQDKARHFIQCPGRTQADALILAEADRMRCPVVSNDFFRDREERYPWVRDRDRVLRHQPIREVLYLGDRALPIVTDLKALRRQIERLFR